MARFRGNLWTGYPVTQDVGQSQVYYLLMRLAEFERAAKNYPLPSSHQITIFTARAIFTPVNPSSLSLVGTSGVSGCP